MNRKHYAMLIVKSRQGTSYPDYVVQEFGGDSSKTLRDQWVQTPHPVGHNNEGLRLAITAKQARSKALLAQLGQQY